MLGPAEASLVGETVLDLEVKAGVGDFGAESAIINVNHWVPDGNVVSGWRRFQSARKKTWLIIIKLILAKKRGAPRGKHPERETNPLLVQAPRACRTHHAYKLLCTPLRCIYSGLAANHLPAGVSSVEFRRRPSPLDRPPLGTTTHPCHVCAMNTSHADQNPCHARRCNHRTVLELPGERPVTRRREAASACHSL